MIAVIGVVLLAAAHSVAQFTPDQVRSVLVEYVGFTEADLAAMDKGEIVVKPVRTGSKQDIAVFGIVRNTRLPQFTMEDFRASLSQKRNKEMSAKGSFSDPPQIADLSALTLEDEDLEELRKCSAGDCDINMSANWIRRFNSEVDWNAADRRERATELFRAMLLDYATQYAAKGAGALGELVNRNKTVDLTRTHRELLSAIVPLNTFAPALSGYLGEFPASNGTVVKNEMHWSSMDFGLNPTVTLTHAAVYTNAVKGNQQHFVVTRQFYSSRYLDASVSLSMLLRVPDGDIVDSYIVFTDRSRSDALDGLFGGVAKGVVENEAVARVTTVLKNSELRLLSRSSRQNEPQTEPETSSGGVLDVLASRILLIAGAAAVLAFIIFAVMRRRNAKS